MSSEGLTSRVESAFGELTRLQQELEDKLRSLAQLESDVQQRSAETSERERELTRRESELQSKLSLAADLAATLDERERQLGERERQLSDAGAELTALDDRSRALDVAEAKLAGREADLGESTAQLERRERELTALEAKLADLQSADAELTRREHDCRRIREDVDTRTALLERLESEAARRDDLLRRREHAVEALCAMFTATASALDDPDADNVAAAAAAAHAAFEARRACRAAGQVALCGPQALMPHGGAASAGVLDAPPAKLALSAPLTETTAFAAGERTRGPAGAKLGGDDRVDFSDFSPEEVQRLRMLRLLGTAADAEIVAMIRAERTTTDSKPKKKRLGLF